jgi:hypothetical protein
MPAAFVDTRRSVHVRSRWLQFYAITLVAILIEKKNRNDRMRMLEIAEADFALEAPSDDGSAPHGTGELTHGADKHGAPKQGQASGTR